MLLLEPDDECAEPRKLYYAPLTFLSHIGSHSIEWPLDLWRTFFSSSLGVSIPILVNHPRTLCACKKHLLGHLPDHVHCCQSMAASTQAHDWAVTQLKALFGSLSHDVRVQTAVTASRGKHRGDVQIREYLHHNGSPRDVVFDLTLTHERWGDTDDPHKKGQLRSPADLDRPLRDAAREKVVKYQSDYANDQRISFLPAAFSTSGRIHEEFLRLLFYHAHLESEEFFRLTGQLAQPNQDYVFSKRAAFFNSLKNKVGHVMARASALRVNLNLQPSAPPLPRPSARTKNAHLLYALNLSHHSLPPRTGA